MKIPLSPPSTEELYKKFLNEINREKIAMLFSQQFGTTDNQGRYLHWDKLRHLPAPEGLSPEEYWFMIKTARRSSYKPVPFLNKRNKNFQYCITDAMLKELHWLDQNCSGTINSDKPIINTQTRDTYLINSLIEESINSSQLEGASTTRDVAKAMLRQKREPKDHSEQMIFNNYHAMQFIREYKNEKLTPAIICELHRILTEKTLDDESKAGNYRSEDDDIYIIDGTESQVLHTPPATSELPERMARICEFANAQNEQNFIHPVIKAIILHFMIGYDHPFVDGNGRTARALFYWSMAQQGYWLIEFISISKIIKQAPVQYGKAYLYTETDDNDLTYFLIHQLEVIRKSIQALYDHLKRKALEMEEVEKRLDDSYLQGSLNHRQLVLIRHALKHPGFEYCIQEHLSAHNISYQTARTDLLALSDKFNLLRKRKYGNSFVFVSPPDLNDKLKSVAQRA
jgi:Fic family protein